MDLPVKLHKQQRILIMIGVLLALQLGGCASRAEFPTGLFDCVECRGMTTRYSGDGTLVVYLRGIEYITGRWSVDEDIFHTGDSYCRDEDAMPASYKWNFDGEILTLRVIEDECSDRVSSLDRKPWKLLEEE